MQEASISNCRQHRNQLGRRCEDWQLWDPAPVLSVPIADQNRHFREFVSYAPKADGPPTKGTIVKTVLATAGPTLTDPMSGYTSPTNPPARPREHPAVLKAPVPVATTSDPISFSANVSVPPRERARNAKNCESSVSFESLPPIHVTSLQGHKNVPDTRGAPSQVGFVASGGIYAE